MRLSKLEQPLSKQKRLESSYEQYNMVHMSFYENPVFFDLKQP